MKFSAAFIAMVLSAPRVVMGATYTYDNQAAWPQADTGDSANECGRDPASGEGQSPIDLPATDCPASDLGNYVFHDGDCHLEDLKYTINNHGVKANYPTTCTAPSMTIPGVDEVFDVLQFHIHTGCEHLMAGKGCDAELHIVHIERTSSASPQLAVVGIMMHSADTHVETFDKLLDEWWEVSCTSYDCGSRRELAEGHTKFSPYSLLNSSTAFLKYFGGLTTPPCTEIVNWNVAVDPTNIGYNQMASLATLIIEYDGYRNDSDACVAQSTVASTVGYTSREVQELLGRTVEKVCSTFQVTEEAFPGASSMQSAGGGASSICTEGAVAFVCRVCDQNVVNTQYPVKSVWTEPQRPLEKIRKHKILFTVADSNEHCLTIIGVRS